MGIEFDMFDALFCFVLFFVFCLLFIVFYLFIYLFILVLFKWESMVYRI